jgi:hypothetical protein
MGLLISQAFLIRSVFTVGMSRQLFEEIITGFFNRFENHVQFQKIHAQIVIAMRAIKFWFKLQPRDRFLKIHGTLRARDNNLL